MKRNDKLGIISFWLLWPALYVYLRPSTRTRVIVIVNDEVLLVKGWLGTGQWMLPGGGLHRNEEPVAGACREVFEETGIMLEPSKLAKICVLNGVGDFGHKSTLVCFSSKLSKKPSLTLQRHEITYSKWVHLVDVESIHISSTTLKIINEYKRVLL